MEKLNERVAWKKLGKQAEKMRAVRLRELFEEDPGRAERFCLEACGLLLDYSKNLITEKTLERLVDLAKSADLPDRIERMFTGRKINETEDRAVLHVALRTPRGNPGVVPAAIVKSVWDVLDAMEEFSADLRARKWLGATDRPITNVVNLGIGGSDLGPAMACEALRPYAAPGLNVRFVSNIDLSHLAATISDLDPAETLFVVASKTFTTQETTTNADSARSWILDALGDERSAADRGDQAAREIMARHFVAVTASPKKARDYFDGAEVPTFEFFDWVGGRFSLCSAIGLPLMIAIGFDNFRRMLEGFHAMDEHFRTTTDTTKNLPVLLALLSLWYNEFFGAQSRAILPYNEALRRFPAYLQQAEMESNGKSSTLEGDPVEWQTSPIVWGQAGTNGQHAFYQLLHQGTKLVPADFLGFARPSLSEADEARIPGVRRDHHDKLMANLMAQTEALAFGNTREEAESAARDWAKKNRKEFTSGMVGPRVFEGNRPTNTILAEQLDPETFGKLVALYEHQIFVQGMIWGINPFDQFGVELGKQVAKERVLPVLDGRSACASLDAPEQASTRRIAEWYLAHR